MLNAAFEARCTTLVNATLSSISAIGLLTVPLPGVSEEAKERDRDILEKQFHEDLSGVPGGSHPGQTARTGATAETAATGTTGHHIETRSTRTSQSAEEGKDPEHVLVQPPSYECQVPCH